MTGRAMIIFWSATGAAVFLLGGSVATLKAVLAGGSPANLVLLAVSVSGLLASLGVAGRIVVVVGRASRPDHHRPTPRQEQMIR